MSEFHKEMASLLNYMTEHMDWETLIECYFENTGYSVKLPWYFVPKLVAQRLVGLKICSKNEVNLSVRVSANNLYSRIFKALSLFSVRLCCIRNML